MIVNKYQGNGGGGGGSYVLPPATQNRLGGIKVGSGVTITNDGTLSAEEATVIDLAVLSAMTSADRVDFWDEVYGKVSDGKSVFMKGLVYGEADRTAVLPVVSFRPETSAATHEGGNIFFGAKGDTDNIYFHINFSSDGSINPTDGMVKTFIVGKASTETLGLVKVGSGLTIDASGVLSISGGTAPAGGGDYMVVSGLPATAQEGQLFYVKPYIETIPYPGYAITATTNEGYVALIYDQENNEIPIYRSGTDFYWDYQNDGGVHKVEGKDFYYKTDNENGVIYVYLPDTSWTITLQEGSTSATTDPYNVEIGHDGETYRYQNSGFTRAGGYDDTYLYFDYYDKDDYYKKQELLEKIFALQLEGRKNIKLFVDNLYADYIDNQNRKLFIFEPYEVSDSQVLFTSSVFCYEGGGGINNPIFATCLANRYENNVAFQLFEASPTIMLYIDQDSHSLDSNYVLWMNINRATRQDTSKPNFLLKYKGKVFNGTYSEGRIYLDGKFKDKTIHGEWTLTDETSYLAEWSETPDKYQTVSGLSNAGVNTVEMNGTDFSAPADFITGLTAETQLFAAKMYDDRYKVLADGTNIKIYYYATDAESWFVAASGTWSDSEIDGNGYPSHPRIYNISTGSTYSFTFVFGDYGEPGEVSELVEYYVPFEGLIAFDTSNSSLNLYAGGQWNTLFPQV